MLASELKDLLAIVPDDTIVTVHLGNSDWVEVDHVVTFHAYGKIHCRIVGEKQPDSQD